MTEVLRERFGGFLCRDEGFHHGTRTNELSGATQTEVSLRDTRAEPARATTDYLPWYSWSDLTPRGFFLRDWRARRVAMGGGERGHDGDALV